MTDSPENISRKIPLASRRRSARNILRNISLGSRHRSAENVSRNITLATTYSLEALDAWQRDLYDEDLATWEKLAAYWGPTSFITWRDEQSFKRAWLVQHERHS